VSSKYEFIDAEKASYPIIRMCEWMDVSRSGFHEWRGREESATVKRQEELKMLIQHVFTDSDGTYGYRRVQAELTRLGVQAGDELVRRLMRELGLVACQPRPWRPVTTIAGDAATIPDLVRRDFAADAPGTKLVGDITYIRTWEGWLYLATVIDCHTKACIGYAMADHLRTELVTAALDMAAANYPLAEDAIFHSDRGTQYTSEAFAEHTGKLGLRRSVGRTGVCYDNAQAETFNAAVKVERVDRTAYPTREHARKDVTRYIEFRYNTKRLHSALGYRTPHEAYTDYINTHNAA
jgi:transposase InsO family protein